MIGAAASMPPYSGICVLGKHGHSYDDASADDEFQERIEIVHPLDHFLFRIKNPVLSDPVRRESLSRIFSCLFRTIPNRFIPPLRHIPSIRSGANPSSRATKNHSLPSPISRATGLTPAKTPPGTRDTRLADYRDDHPSPAHDRLLHPDVRHAFTPSDGAGRNDHH